MSVEDPVGPFIPRTPTRTGFDNPELRTLVTLPDGMSLDSLVPILNSDNTITPGHVTFAEGDFQLFVSGGDGPTNSDGTLLDVHEASVAASLTPWPEQTTTIIGNGVATADLFARGLRVGYTPLLVQARRVNGDAESVNEFETAA